jgi:hypothetical protein
MDYIMQQYLFRTDPVINGDPYSSDYSFVVLSIEQKLLDHVKLHLINDNLSTRKGRIELQHKMVRLTSPLFT